MLAFDTAFSAALITLWIKLHERQTYVFHVGCGNHGNHMNCILKLLLRTFTACSFMKLLWEHTTLKKQIDLIVVR